MTKAVDDDNYQTRVVQKNHMLYFVDFVYPTCLLEAYSLGHDTPDKEAEQ